METGIITKPSVWLYGENLKDPTDELFMGWTVKILQRNGGWLRVITHYGYPGWLREEALCQCRMEDVCKKNEAEHTLYISRAFADVLEKPRVQGKILCTLCRGAFLSGMPETQNGYRRVRLADGREGYLPVISCRKRKETDGYFYDDNPEQYFLRQTDKILCEEQALRDKIVLTAKSYLGTQYRWAGKSAAGIDCSGLAFMSYLLNGLLIYRDADLNDAYPVKKISMNRQIKPGDLLYFPGHVAIYLGDMKYIHATGNEKSFGCVISSLSKKDWNYRKDLADSLLMAGSIW